MRRIYVDPLKLYYLAFIERRPQTELCEIFNISLPTLLRRLREVRGMKFEITFDYYEREVLGAYLMNTDQKEKLKLLEIMGRLLERKSKLKNLESESINEEEKELIKDILTMGVPNNASETKV